MATDLDGHVLWLNREAEELFAGRAGGAVPSRCYDLVGGLDAFGNRFCYEDCPLVAMARRGEAIRSFEMAVGGSGPRERLWNVTVLEVPGPRNADPKLVHLFHPIDRRDQLRRGLAWLAGPRTGSQAPRTRPAEATRPPLTPRQAEILGWMATGLQNKEIAERAGIAVATVRNHVSGILEALGVHSKLEAVALAYFRGWVTPVEGGGAAATRMSAAVVAGGAPTVSRSERPSRAREAG